MIGYPHIACDRCNVAIFTCTIFTVDVFRRPRASYSIGMLQVVAICLSEAYVGNGIHDGETDLCTRFPRGRNIFDYPRPVYLVREFHMVSPIRREICYGGNRGVPFR